MKPHCRLVKEATGEIVVENLEVADRYWSRFRGLQLRRQFPIGVGLLLVPCNSIHTMFVRFPIDVIFLDRQGIAVAIRQNIPPWRLILPVRGAHATLEVPVGTAYVAPGERLSVQIDSLASNWAKSLDFLRSATTP